MVDYEAFLTFARSKQGELLYTRARGRTFRVSVEGDALVFTPGSGLARATTNRKQALAILERHAETDSLRPVDYQDLTFNASYFLTILWLFQEPTDGRRN